MGAVGQGVEGSQVSGEALGAVERRVAEEEEALASGEGGVR